MCLVIEKHVLLMNYQRKESHRLSFYFIFLTRKLIIVINRADFDFAGKSGSWNKVLPSCARFFFLNEKKKLHAVFMLADIIDHKREIDIYSCQLDRLSVWPIVVWNQAKFIYQFCILLMHWNKYLQILLLNL